MDLLRGAGVPDAWRATEERGRRLKHKTAVTVEQRGESRVGPSWQKPDPGHQSQTSPNEPRRPLPESTRVPVYDADGARSRSADFLLLFTTTGSQEEQRETPNSWIRLILRVRAQQGGDITAARQSLNSISKS